MFQILHIKHAKRIRSFYPESSFILSLSALLFGIISALTSTTVHSVKNAYKTVNIIEDYVNFCYKQNKKPIFSLPFRRQYILLHRENVQF